MNEPRYADLELRAEPDPYPRVPSPWEHQRQPAIDDDDDDDGKSGMVIVYLLAAVIVVCVGVAVWVGWTR